MVGEIDQQAADGTTGITYANGLRTEIQYDIKGRPTAIDNERTMELVYQYDEYGQIIGIDENGKHNRYDYDAQGRLLNAETALGLYSYRYDQVGNRTQRQHASKSGDITTKQYTYADIGEGNRLIGIRTDKADYARQQYNYNAAGSPTVVGGLRYEYNVKQRPVKVYRDNTLIAIYAYNRFGERIKKVVYNNAKKPTVTYYLYDGHTLTAEADANGTIIAQYMYLDSHQPVIKLQGRDVYAIHSDHLGTPRTVTNEEQEVVWQANYSPFGKASITTAQITLNLRFPGQYEDTETGTYYNYLRDYDPDTGRYITSDPIGLKAGVNTYAYVSGNPLNMMDPLGLLQVPTNPTPGTALYRALVQAGLIAVADGPEPGPADAAAAGYIVGAVIGITIGTVVNYLNRPEQEDIDYLFNEIKLYKPDYTRTTDRSWDNHEQLILDLYLAQTEYVKASKRKLCTADSNNDIDPALLQRAEQALAIRDRLYASLNSIQAYYSPEGIYFPNEAIYRAERFAYEAYLEKGGDLSFDEWYYKVRLSGTPSAAGKPDGYTNPGHHDPSNTGPNVYNSTKSVLPDNHQELWNNSVPDPNNPNTRWTKVGNGRNAVYHRFQSSNDGTWHWNGSTNGVTKKGEPRAIPLSRVPNLIRRM